LEGAVSGKKGHGKTWTTILKARRQEHRSGQLYNNEKNSLQQIQMESCQPIRRLKKKKEEEEWHSMAGERHGRGAGTACFV